MPEINVDITAKTLDPKLPDILVDRVDGRITGHEDGPVAAFELLARRCCVEDVGKLVCLGEETRTIYAVPTSFVVAPSEGKEMVAYALCETYAWRRRRDTDGLDTYERIPLDAVLTWRDHTHPEVKGEWEPLGSESAK